MCVPSGVGHWLAADRHLNILLSVFHAYCSLQSYVAESAPKRSRWDTPTQSPMGRASSPSVSFPQQSPAVPSYSPKQGGMQRGSKKKKMFKGKMKNQQQ